MDTTTKHLFGHLAEWVLDNGAKRATKYLSEKLTITATYQGKHRARDSSRTLLFTIGAPNYASRQFIKKCKAAGEPFPVKRLQIAFDDSYH